VDLVTLEIQLVLEDPEILERQLNQLSLENPEALGFPADLGVLVVLGFLGSLVGLEVLEHLDRHQTVLEDPEALEIPEGHRNLCIQQDPENPVGLLALIWQ
jgi:hypothetical protein